MEQVLHFFSPTHQQMCTGLKIIIGYSPVVPLVCIYTLSEVVSYVELILSSLTISHKLEKWTCCVLLSSSSWIERFFFNWTVWGLLRFAKRNKKKKRKIFLSDGGIQNKMLSLASLNYFFEKKKRYFLRSQKTIIRGMTFLREEVFFFFFFWEVGSHWDLRTQGHWAVALSLSLRDVLRQKWIITFFFNSEMLWWIFFHLGIFL